MGHEDDEDDDWIEGPLYDTQGRLVDDAYVDAAVAEARAQRGRPSLSGSGESPVIRVRVGTELEIAVQLAAERAGQTVAEWIRAQLTEATKRQE